MHPQPAGGAGFSAGENEQVSIKRKYDLRQPLLLPEMEAV